MRRSTNTLSRWALATTIAFAISAAPSCFKGPIDWPEIATCGAGVVDDLFPAISRILLEAEPIAPGDGLSGQLGKAGVAIGDHAAGELDKLAREHGADAVACVVDTLVRDWLSPGASQDPARIQAALRGRNYLEARGVEPASLGRGR